MTSHPIHDGTKRRTRLGMLLPLVLVSMLLVFTIAASLQQVAWRAARGAQSQWDAQRGTYAADAAAVRAVANWQPDSIAATPIGTALVRDEVYSDGWRTRTSIARTGPLRAAIVTVAVRDRAARLGDIDAASARRVVVRSLPLAPPSLPLTAVVTMLGPVAIESALLDGQDVVASYDGARDDCGERRDTKYASDGFPPRRGGCAGRRGGGCTDGRPRGAKRRVGQRLCKLLRGGETISGQLLERLRYGGIHMRWHAPSKHRDGAHLFGHEFRDDRLRR